MLKDINYICLSDLHLGRENNNVDSMFSTLVTYFTKNRKVMKNLDYMFINGDVYDRLLINGSYEANRVTEVLLFILTYCVDNHIGLRILKGTPGHDWDQLDSIELLINTHPLYSQMNFKYVKVLEIERLETHDVTVLYVPDEWRTNPLDTYLEVLDLLNKHNLKKVDFCMMHGFFKYQLPAFIGVGHDETKYLEICNYYIHIGHVHTFSTFMRIIANGSFDRLAHNEEEDKGAVICKVTTEGDMRSNFIVNTKALLFKKIPVSTIGSINELRVLIRKTFGNKNGRLRLIFDNEVDIDVNTLREQFKNLFIDTDIIKAKDDKVQTLETICVVDITKDNIASLLLTIDKDIDVQTLSNYL